MLHWAIPLTIGVAASLAVWSVEVAEKAKTELDEVRAESDAVTARLDAIEALLGVHADPAIEAIETRVTRLEAAPGGADVTRIDDSVARLKSALNELDVRLGLLDARAMASLVPVQRALVNDVAELKRTLAELAPTLDDVLQRTQNIDGGVQDGRKWTTILFGDAEARFRPDGIFAVYGEDNRRKRLISTGP